MSLPLPSIEQYLASHPDADPKTMLDVLLAKNLSLREEAEIQKQEWKETNEVTLDADLNFQPNTLAQLQRLAVLYATSGIVPDHYSVLNPGEYAKKVAACTIGIQMALRMKVDILTFLQCSFVHKGKIGVEAKLLMARLNTSGKIKGRVAYKFEGSGETRKCTAYAVDAESGQEFSQTVSWEMVKAEGWNLSNGSQKSKWITLTDLMFQYRAGVFLGRVHYPDVLLGLYSSEELDDIRRGGGAPQTESLEELGQSLMASSDAEPPAPKKRGPKPKAAETKTPDEPAAETPPAEALPKSQAAPEPKPEPKSQPKPEPATEAPKAPAVKLPNIPNYLRSLYEDGVEGFDLDAIATACEAEPKRWSQIAKGIIEKTAPGWETFLLADEEPGFEPDEEPADAADAVDQSAEETDENVPTCVSHPTIRPSDCDPVVDQMEKEISKYVQPKRIRDFFTSKIAPNPHLLDNERQYLRDLCNGRAWCLEHDVEYPRGLKIK